MSNKCIMEKMCCNTIRSIGGNCLGYNITFEDGLNVLIHKDDNGFIYLKEIGGVNDGGKLSNKVEVKSHVVISSKFINWLIR